MGGTRCVSCGRVLGAEDALCPGCGSRPVALPAVGAPEVDAGAGLGEVEVRATVGSPVPARLRGEFRVERVLEDASTEADLFVVVRDVEGGGVERRVLKRYLRSQPPRPGPGVSDERRASRVQGFEAQQARERSELRAALELLREVDDAHVIGVEDFDVDEGWELLEFVGGGTLAGLIAERVAGSVPFGEGEVLRIVEELALALVAIHEARLSHFDIKPENVLVRSRDPLDLVLTDFGTLAPMPTSVYVHGGGVQADALYVAPERAGATRTSKADVFGVGRIAQQMLRIGRGGGPDADVLEGLAGEERARWELMLLGALQREPAVRWDAEELLAWTRGEEVRRVEERGGAVVGEGLLVVAGREPVSAVEMVRLIVGSPEGWRSGREHLDRGRLRGWADGKRPELARALDPGGKLDRIGDAGLRLLEVLLWIDPELPAAYAGMSLLADNVAELHDGAPGSLGQFERGALLDHLAGAAEPVPADRTLDRVTASLPSGVAAAVDRLAAGDSIAREPLRRLIVEMARRREELDRAVEALGLTDIRAELRLQLLRRVAREQSGARDRAPGPLALLRRPRWTRAVLRDCSPTVRAILVPLVLPSSPLGDAGRAPTSRCRVRQQRHDARPSIATRFVTSRSARPSRRRRTVPDVFARTFALVRSRPRHVLLGTLAVVVLGWVASSLVLNLIFPLVTIRTPFDARISERDYMVDPAPAAFRGHAGRTNAFPDPVAQGREALEVDWVRDTGITPELIERIGRWDSLAPVVAGDLVVVSGPGVIAALDAGSGEQRWARVYRPRSFLGVTAVRQHLPAAVTADTVYVTSRHAGLSPVWLKAHDAEDGRVRWRKRIATRGDLFGDEDVGTPVVAEGRVFVSIDTFESIIAVDARTGRLLWTYAEASTIRDDGRAELHSDPVVLDGRLYAVFEGPSFDTSRLVVLDAATGQVIWREQPVADAVKRAVGPVQIAAGSGMVVTAAGGAVRAYRAPYGGDRTRPTLTWTRQLAHPVRSMEGTLGIALTEDAVYVGVSNSGRLIAYSHAGEQLWMVRATPVESGSYWIMPLVAGDSVFAVLWDGAGLTLQQFDARSGAGRGQGLREDFEDDSFMLPFLATSEGRLFVPRYDGTLTAYR